MKVLFHKAITTLIAALLIFNQSVPVAAAAPTAPINEATTHPAMPREMGKKPARPQKYDQPPAPEAPGIALKLAASPRFITAAGQVTVHWRVDNLSVTSVAAKLSIRLPDGYIPVNGSGYDAATQTLIIPNPGTEGDFTINVQTPLENASLQASLSTNTGSLLADTSLSLPLHEKFNQKKSGGLFSAQKGRIKVRFGKNSLPEDATVNIGTPAGDAAPTHSLSGHPFELDAQGATSHKDLRKFAENVSIDVDYSDMGLSTVDEGNLYLYYYDPETDDWYALPTSVDPKTKTLHASTSHFTVFDTGINDFQASRTPTLDAFQVSTFTGAATYSMPIEVPPGPGGMQPSLELSYNSQIIDQSTIQTQASWVGMGWSLGMNLIELNDNGSNQLIHPDMDTTRDDTWSINVNGISSTLIKDSNGVYRAADENFMRFDHNINETSGLNTWTVWDKQGNQYFFEKVVKTLYKQSGNASTLCNYQLEPYQWYLTRMRNVFGQELTYTYVDERKDVNVPIWMGGRCNMAERTESMVTATYPDTITYPLRHNRIRFELGTRQDYRKSWVTDIAYHNFQQSRLSTIFVEQRESVNDNWSIIRKYVFEYARNDSATWGVWPDGITHAPLWPGVTWSGGGKTSTLLQVHQFGVTETDELPTATFSYIDQMHLTHADNGYGGAVEFTYTPWYYTPRARASQTYETDFNYGGPNACWTGNFHPYPATATNSVDCIHNGNGSNFLKLTGQGINPYMLGIGLAQNNAVRPGGFYKFTFERLNKIAPTDLKYGFKIRNEPDDVLLVDDETDIFAMPAYAAKADVVLSAINSTHETEYVSLRSLKVELLTSVYRVVKRTIVDGLGHENVYTYSYKNAAGNQSAAVNDSYHSDSACDDSALDAEPTPTCQQYHEKYSEFRGHGQVTESAPDGHTTTTIFYQDDILKGRPSSVTVNDANGNIISKQIIAYRITTLSMPFLLGRNSLYKDGRFHYWVTTASEENRIYNSSGNGYNATKTTYQYASASDANGYGNLLSKTESIKNGSNWNIYRTTNFEYIPNVSPTLNLTGLPARQWVTDAGNTILTQTLNLYDGAQNWHDAPTTGKLTAVRTLVSSPYYAQVSYGYDDWGNRTSTSTYSQYATATVGPDSASEIKQTSTYDGIYHAYVITQTAPRLPGFASGFTTRFDDGNKKACTPLSTTCTQTDPNGIKTTVRYDSLGRLTTVVKESGSPTASTTLEVRYNDLARPFTIELKQKVDNTHNYLIRHSYDGLGREVITETGSGDFGSSFAVYNRVDHGYGYSYKDTPEFKNLAFSQQSAPYDPATESPVYTTTIVDALGRPLRVIPPDRKGVSYMYDSLLEKYDDGITTTITDANGHATSTLTDIWGRTRLVTPPTGPKVKYVYNPMGQLTDATRGPNPDDINDPDNTNTHLTYNNAGQKIAMQDTDMGAWTYAYDALGNLYTQTDARNCITNLRYDLLNRLTSKTYTGTCNSTSPINYTYDTPPTAFPDSLSIGRRTGMSTAGSASVWRYDARGRVTDERKTIDLVNDSGAAVSMPYTTHTTYNNADMPLSITYPDGETIINNYNPQLLLEQVTSSQTNAAGQPQSYIKNIRYDTSGRVRSRTMGNDLVNQYTYYSPDTQGGRLHTLTTSGGLGDLQNLTYTYDNIGNISQIMDGISGQIQKYTYDSLDRIEHAEATNIIGDSGYDENYRYNSNTGNLENKGGLTLYYNDAAHKHAVSSLDNNNGNPGDDNIYQYDQNGNQTWRMIDGQPFNLTYDAEGRLLTVSNDNPQSAPPTQVSVPVVSATPSATPTQPPSSLTFTSIAAEDGTVIEASQTSESGGSIDTASTTISLGDNASNAQMRGILSFDTSTLPDDAVIQSATLRIKQWSVIGNDNPLASSNLRVDIAPVPGKFYTAYSLQNGDFEAAPGGDTVTIIARGTAPDANGWFASGLNASGKTLINRTGKTQLRLRFGQADNNDNAADYVKILSGDYAGSGSPELVITYTSASSIPPATVTATAAPATATATQPAAATPTEADTATGGALTSISAKFTYDADGQMVKSEIASSAGAGQAVTTAFISPVYQVKNPASPQPVVTKYYPGGAMRVDGTLYYTLSDHLGSTSLTTDTAGAKIAETRYNAWGETRYTSGNLLTDRTYTGQRSYASDFGLIYYNARWYDTQVGRFAQADSIVPGGVQGYDRYAYVNNNPVNKTDPTGHCAEPVTFTLCILAIGAGIGASISMLQQYHDTGHVDLPKVGEAAFNGAAAAAAVTVTVAVAATGIGAAVEAVGIVSAIGSAGAAGAEAACADGDCGNEVAAVEETFSATAQNITAATENLEPFDAFENVALLDPADELSQEGAPILRQNPLQKGIYTLLGHGLQKYPYVKGPNGNLLDADALSKKIINDPAYVKGSPICLAVCWGASSGIAERLANRMGVAVYASTTEFDNSFIPENKGYWKWIEPIEKPW